MKTSFIQSLITLCSYGIMSALVLAPKSLQAQCCQGALNSYSETDPNYHVYKVESKPICNTSQKGCTIDFVYKILTSDIRFVGPTFDNTSVSVSNCGIYRVQFFPLIGYFDGSICVRTNPTLKSVTNYTLPDHYLHPGKVERKIIQKPNGDIILFSLGVGTGSFPGLNKKLADLVWQAETFWKGPNTLLIEEAQKQLPEPIGDFQIPADMKDDDPRSPQVTVEEGDLVIVEVLSNANLGLFTQNVPAYGTAAISRLLMFNKEQYKNFNHGALICRLNQQIMPCNKDPYSRWLSLNDRVLLPQQVFPGVIFLATSGGTLSFDINDNEPQNNWGFFETKVTIVSQAKHHSNNTGTALKAYLSKK